MIVDSVDAHRVRRRRRVLVCTAAALAVPLIALGGLALTTRPRTQIGPGGPSTTRPLATGPDAAVSSAPTRALPLDVLVDNTLYLADGGTLALPPLGSMSVSNVWRVASGYLISTDNTGAASLLYVPTSGGPRTLATGTSVIVAAGTVERPGVQVAWRDDGGVHVGTFANGAVTDVVSTQVAGVDVSGLTWKVQLYPHAIVGGAVVLAGTKTGGGLDTWDVWFPARGPYVPTAEAPPFADMLAVTADGEQIIGSDNPNGQKPGCLGEFDPDGFAMVNHVCPTLFDSFGFLDPSPDGRWWLVVEPSKGVRLFDTQTVWNGGAPVRTWSIDAGDGVWVDASRVLLRTNAGGAVVLNTADGSMQQLSLPAGDRKPIFVVNLR